ncbi:MAG: ParB/RepB/Spo0J family partition protein [bacterium]|nr:ParB/RepB/Spo0J family partition protein [bacterium]
MQHNANEFQKIPLSSIRVDEWNVRTLDRDKGVDELANSIQEFGLLQPIVVYKSNGDYKLIIGQRRYRAYKELIKKDRIKYSYIPARILSNPPDQKELKILSLSENIHRVELNRMDIVNAVSYLYSVCNKSAKDVAKLLGKSISFVYEHLKIQDAPEELKDMLSEKKISKEDVKRVMEIAADDKNKMVELAKEMHNLIKPEKMRFHEISRQKPNATVKELVEEAKRPKIEEKVIVALTPILVDALDRASKKIGLSREEVAKRAIQEWLDNQGFYKEL